MVLPDLNYTPPKEDNGKHLKKAMGTYLKMQLYLRII
jgi:hypothetical protein